MLCTLEECHVRIELSVSTNDSRIPEQGAGWGWGGGGGGVMAGTRSWATTLLKLIQQVIIVNQYIRHVK